MATELRISSTPWEVSNTSPAQRGPVVIKSASGLYVASVATVPDARVMAAAPELFAALIALEADCWCPWRTDFDDHHTAPCLQARAAIAKARGEGSADVAR